MEATDFAGILLAALLFLIHPASVRLGLAWQARKEQHAQEAAKAARAAS